VEDKLAQSGKKLLKIEDVWSAKGKLVERELATAA
jgi:hypothetical protein